MQGLKQTRRPVFALITSETHEMVLTKHGSLGRLGRTRAVVTRHPDHTEGQPDDLRDEENCGEREESV